jgi:hypothetical protein
MYAVSRTAHGKLAWPQRPKCFFIMETQSILRYEVIDDVGLSERYCRPAGWFARYQLCTRTRVLFFLVLSLLVASDCKWWWGFDSPF